MIRLTFYCISFIFYIRKGIVVVLKNEIPYSKCLNGVLRFFFYIILAILHLERGH